MQKYLIIGLSAMVLTACSTSSKIASDDIGSIDNTNQGVIIASYGGEDPCEDLKLEFKNVETGQIVKASRISAEWMKSGKSTHDKIGLAAVPPGKYKFAGGGCRSFGGVTDYDNVLNWFKPFEVKAGETVYPGTLVPDEFEARDSRAKKAVFQTYVQADKTDLVKSRLAEVAPQLSDGFVTRLAPIRLDAAILKDLTEKASVSKDDKDNKARLAAASKARSALGLYMLTGLHTPTD